MVNIFIYILFIPFIFFGQKIETYKEIGEIHAIEDFNLGAGIVGYYYNIINPDYKTIKFIEFNKVFYLKKYNINYEIVNVGCLIPENYNCYKNSYKKHMDSLVLKKYGGNFIKNTEKEILKEYEIFKNATQNELKKYINFDHIYDFAESLPKFIGNEKNLSDFINNFIISNFENKNLKQIALSIEYSENGSITNCFFTDAIVFFDKIYNINDYNFEKNNDNKYLQLEKELTKSLNNLGQWIPAYLYQNKIKFNEGFVSLSNYTEY